MIFSPIAAITSLTVRDAIRSKLMVSLGLLLIAGVIGLPWLITGDNTLNGRLHVLLNYTLTYATVVLSATALLTGCTGVSSDIEDRRLYLVLTKPVHRCELWLGKWIGMTAIYAFLLAVTGLIVLGMARHTVRTAPESVQTKQDVTEALLLARDAVRPSAPFAEAQVVEAARQLLASGKAPAGMDESQLRARLLDELNAKRFTIPPAGAVTFSYSFPPASVSTHDLILRYRFESTRPERTSVAAEWIVANTATGARHIAVTNYPGIPASITIPPDLLGSATSLTVTYHRLDLANPATLLMADQGHEPELLVGTGGFALNLARGLLIILCRVALMAAIGLTAGCLFSSPVAIFAAFFIMVLMASAGYVDAVASSGVFFVPHEGHQHGGMPQSHPWIDGIVLALFRLFNHFTHPLLEFNPVPLLTEGRLIREALVLRAAGWMIGVYTTVTAAVGIALFNRREIG